MDFATLSSRLVKFRDISTILYQSVHNRDIGLNSGIVPAKPGHLANMDKGAQERQSRMEIRTALPWQNMHGSNNTVSTGQQLKC